MMISEPTPFSHSFNFNDMQRIHPLSDSPKTSAFFRTTSPVQSTNIDDVTTIFVVGFPEDMAEREFQNMFTFCHGFEAASLKWHCKDQEDETVPSNGGKKQMIGFARFRTRLEALEAIEVLNGKKIDGDKGTVLKAEMAKKNLHIKRGSATQTSTSTSSSTTTSTAATVQPVATNSTSSPSSLMMASSVATSDSSFKNLRYDSFSPLPSDLLQQDLFSNDPLMNTSFNDSLFGIRSHSFDHQDLGFRTSFNQHNTISTSPFHFQQHQHLQQHIPTSNTARKLMNDNEQDFPYLSKSTPVHEDHDLMRMSSLSIQPTRLPNPADQNPPCNTLYVGNLPPNTQEEELRHLFAACKGYRRMCFRTKPQGPMCFVEFDDIVFATQALNELQGQTLSNSLKGGIRLSYSKNPLFIKPTNNKENGVMSFKQMGTALMADRRDFMFDPQL